MSLGGRRGSCRRAGSWEEMDGFEGDERSFAEIIITTSVTQAWLRQENEDRSCTARGRFVQ